VIVFVSFLKVVWSWFGLQSFCLFFLVFAGLIGRWIMGSWVFELGLLFFSCLGVWVLSLSVLCLCFLYAHFLLVVVEIGAHIFKTDRAYVNKTSTVHILFALPLFLLFARVTLFLY
jgi:hypothetical protein